MQADGLLVRRRSAVDRRAASWQLSGHGQALLQIARDRRVMSASVETACRVDAGGIPPGLGVSGRTRLDLVSALTDESLEPSRVQERAA